MWYGLRNASGGGAGGKGDVGVVGILGAYARGGTSEPAGAELTGVPESVWMYNCGG